MTNVLEAKDLRRQALGDLLGMQKLIDSVGTKERKR